jgi:hypothetical protein
LDFFLSLAKIFLMPSPGFGLGLGGALDGGGLGTEMPGNTAGLPNDAVGKGRGEVVLCSVATGDCFFSKERASVIDRIPSARETIEHCPYASLVSS